MGTLSVFITCIFALIIFVATYLSPFVRSVEDGRALISMLIWLFCCATVISYFTALVSAWKKENPQESESED